MDRVFPFDSASETLLEYYLVVFPAEILHNWLNYGEENLFRFREFSFLLHDGTFISKQLFSSLNELKYFLTRKLPIRIDLGRIANGKSPEDYEKELVIDIDISDYDDVRACCSGKNCCNKCWKFIVIAVIILTNALKEDWGFQQFFWSYSGRRGVHCWVIDKEARKLSDKERSVIVDNLSLRRVGSILEKQILPRAVRRSIDLIEKEFVQWFVKDLDIFGSPRQLETLLSYIPNKDTQVKLREKLQGERESVESWKIFCEEAEKMGNCMIVPTLMLRTAHPRLDFAVTKQKTHLVKAPFNVHPDTKRICLPFHHYEILNFSPDDMLTVEEICRLRTGEGRLTIEHLNKNPFVERCFKWFCDCTSKNVK